MSNNYDVKNITVRAIRDDVLVSNMDMGEQTTAAGIVIKSDDGKSHGVKPRWARVYKVGPKQLVIKEGDWVLVEHGRWTRKIKINDGNGTKEIQKVEVKSIMATAAEKPDDFYIGQEHSNGSSIDIKPEDFLPGNLAKIT